MKKLLVLFVLIFGGFFIFNNRREMPSGELGIAAESVSALKMARLYASEPDRRIDVPVEGVRLRQISDTWGAARGEDRSHQGQDIFAPRGTQVFSATDGFVYRIGESKLGGKTVWIVGAGGRAYYYAHLEDYAADLNVGDFVTRKTVLGFVGNTGNAKGTPPHLHFGVYTSAGAINPLPLLAD